MRVKRFIASDMRSAMQQVRESLGAEAVILSNRMVDDGVEILASNDYDQSVHADSSPKPAKRSYNTYAEVPDEPAKQVFEEDKVMLSSLIEVPPVVPKKPKLGSRIGGMFDRKHNLTGAGVPEPVQTAVPAEPEAAVQSPVKARSKIDYSKFIVEDEAEKTETEHLQPANQSVNREQHETEDLKRELRALRSMMETQMGLMNWEQQKHQNPVRIGLLKRFSELGLTVDISKQVLENVGNTTDAKLASKQAISNLVQAIPVASDDILKRQGIIALVGPTGVGKTTTIAKLAARYVMAHGQDQIALVTLDNYRIGAQEQLFNYARILRVPVHNAKNSNELHKVLQNLYDKKLIMIDTAGMSQKDMRICEQFNTLRQGADDVRSYLVLAANAQTSALDEIIRAFKQTEISGCIFTKLDESASLGGAISMLVRHQLPIAYISEGQAVPEDLQSAYAKELVSKALDLLKKNPEQIDENDLALAFNDGMIHAH